MNYKDYLGGAFNEETGELNMDLAQEKALIQRVKLNIILMGATGVGKSSLINSMFGEKVVETGVGKPVTQNLQKIELKNKPIVLWDTKGIEVEDYVGTKFQLMQDIENAIKEALHSNDENKFPHIALLCIKESSHRVEDYHFDLLNKMKEYDIPTIVVFTNKSNSDGNNQFVGEAKKLINQQYSAFIQDRYVRVNSVSEYNQDFDAWTKLSGQQELLDLMEKCTEDVKHSIGNKFSHFNKELKDALLRAQIVNSEKRLKAMSDDASTKVHIAAVAAATAGASPIPGSDAPIIAGIQSTMIYSINTSFELQMDKSIATSTITGILGVTAIAQVGKTIVANALKFIPGPGTLAGAAISAATAAAITEAIGHAYIAVLEQCYDKEKGKVILPQTADMLLDIFKTVYKKP